MRYLIYISFLFLACKLDPSYHAIEVPEVSGVSTMMNEENRWERSSGNLSSLKTQLSYYQKKGWPEGSEASVRVAEKYLYRDKLFFIYCIDYHRSKGNYARVLSLLNVQGPATEENESLLRLRIEALVGVGEDKQADQLIKKYASVYSGLDHQLFLAQQRSKMGQEVLALYHFHQAQQLGADTKLLVENYVPLLMKYGYWQKAELLLERLLEQQEPSFEYPERLAEVYWKQGKREQATGILKTHLEREHLFTLSGWFRESRKWDSAYWAMERILVQNPQDLSALTEKGDIDQDRGYFYRARNIYRSVLEQDSTYQPAVQQLDLVQRKIAYLQKIREQKQDTVPQSEEINE
jgi:tetratricopeptide (TPR) repeat protein